MSFYEQCFAYIQIEVLLEIKQCSLRMKIKSKIILQRLLIIMTCINAIKKIIKNM